MRMLIASLVLALLSVPALAAEGEAPSKEELVAQAMSIYQKRASLMLHKRAVGAFAGLAKAYPDDKDLQIWCARTAYYASHRIDDSKVKMRVANQGLACANRLVKKDSRDYDGQIWRLLTRFRAEQARGVFAALDAVKPIRDQLLGLIKSSPDRAEAYMMLGAIYRELPGSPISFGDADKALKLLEKADQLDPNNPEILLELALAYEKVGKETEARATYRRCIKEAKGPEELSWEIQDAKDYAQKMLREMD